MVGYELYCELLQQAVHHLKRQPLKQAIEVDVDLPGEGRLPLRGLACGFIVHFEIPRHG